ncbi:MAG: hypothetical protein HY696_11430 [Deltaproteobacteria bacterium]|nr:hypothetical protein [Deltaproteobacteria bacterium]
MKTTLQAIGMLVTGSLLGLLYVIFLPFIGFTMVFYHGIVWAGRAARRAVSLCADAVERRVRDKA